MTSRTKPQKPSSCSTICRNAEKWIPQLLVDSFRFPQAQCIGHFWYDVDGNYKTPDESVIISLSSFNGAGVESLERWFEQPPCWSLQMKFNSCCQVFKLTNSPRIWLSPGTFQPLTTPLFTALFFIFLQEVSKHFPSCDLHDSFFLTAARRFYLLRWIPTCAIKFSSWLIVREFGSAMGRLGLWRHPLSPHFLPEQFTSNEHHNSHLLQPNDSVLIMRPVNQCKSATLTWIVFLNS